MQKMELVIVGVTVCLAIGLIHVIVKKVFN